MMDLEKEVRSIFDGAEQARLLSLNANIESVRAADKWETDFPGYPAVLQLYRIKQTRWPGCRTQAAILPNNAGRAPAAEALNTIECSIRDTATHNACLRLAETVMLSKSSEEVPPEAALLCCTSRIWHNR